MTSSEPIISRTGRPTGMWSSLISRRPSACCAFHIHCFAVMYTSIAPSGGRYMRKKTLAPQKNITIVMPSGMNVHASSSGSDPVMPAPTWSGWRRRYFTANSVISPKIRIVKKAETAIRKKYSVSTSAEIVDPSVGNRGRLGIPVTLGVRGRHRLHTLLAEHDRDVASERDERDDRADLDQADRDQAVAALHRVVLEAEQQRLVRKRA